MRPTHHVPPQSTSPKEPPSLQETSVVVSFSLANSPPIFARLRAMVFRAKGSGKESRDGSRLETLFGEERWGKADIGQASDNGGSAVEVGGAGDRSLHRQEHVREGVRVVAGGGAGGTQVAVRMRILALCIAKSTKEGNECEAAHAQNRQKE
jgi:hypothetical protein